MKEVMEYLESPRRKALEKQVQESVQRPVKADIPELTKAVEHLQASLDAYTLEIAINQRMVKMLTVEELRKKLVELTTNWLKIGSGGGEMEIDALADISYCAANLAMALCKADNLETNYLTEEDKDV